MNKYINLPLNDEIISELQAGDYVYLSGVIYSARDAAHKRMQDGIPFDIKNQTVYYLGPSPAREGNVIGSAGPTTSSRMDKYTPDLLEHGLKGMIGKGKRSKEVIDSIIKNKAVYFAAVGGAGAILSKCITSSEVIAMAFLPGVNHTESEIPEAAVRSLFWKAKASFESEKSTLASWTCAKKPRGR